MKVLQLGKFYPIRGGVEKEMYDMLLAPQLVATLRKVCKQYDIIHIHHPDPMACLSLFLSGYRGKVMLHWHSDILKQKMQLKLYKPLQTWLIKRAEVIAGTIPTYVTSVTDVLLTRYKVAKEEAEQDAQLLVGQFERLGLLVD